MSEDNDPKSSSQIAEILQTKVAEQITQEWLIPLFGPAAQQGGLLLGETLHTFRRTLAWVATSPQRVSRAIQRALSRVPEARLISPAPEIVVPLLEGLSYQLEDSPIALMFEQLLAHAIDKEHSRDTHPSFAKLIGQLSPDEALILYWLKKGPCEWLSVYRSRRAERGELQIARPEHGGARGELVGQYPQERIKQIARPEHLGVYKSHLRLLGLSTEVYNLGRLTRETATTWGFDFVDDHDTVEDIISLTPFGKLFEKSCIPDSGFDI